MHCCEMHLFRLGSSTCATQEKAWGGWYLRGRCPEVLAAMGDEDAVEELFKTDPLQEGLALPQATRASGSMINVLSWDVLK